MSISQNLIEIQNHLPTTTTLIAVSKTHPSSAILQAYTAKQKAFGENKVQELLDKYDTLPKDIEWHFIGHLQSNKVKYIAPFVHLIHGVDSLKLLKEINKEGQKINRIIPVLLQIHIATEESKFGFSSAELLQLLSPHLLSSLPFINIRGVMGMATYTEDENTIRKEFKTLKNIFSDLKQHFFTDNNNFTEVSMGMSGDYKLAIEEGSTMVRVGSLIFGSRAYKSH